MVLFIAPFSPAANELWLNAEVASGIACASCRAPLSLDRDLLARRFLLGEAQRRLAILDVVRAQLHARGQPMEDPDRLPVLDHSRAVYQHLLGCSGCLAITRTDRPVASDDVVPGKISLAVPGAVVVRAARRLESAAATGRIDRELRTLCADPLRRYTVRIPPVFRTARAGFGDALMLVADVASDVMLLQLIGPQGIVWDEGARRPGNDPPRLGRLVKRAIAAMTRECLALPFERGEVSVHGTRDTNSVARFARGTKLRILRDDGAAFRVAAPRVRFEDPHHQRYYDVTQPFDEFVLPMDLAVPA